MSITNQATVNQMVTNLVEATVLLPLTLCKYQNGTTDKITVIKGDIIKYKITIENENDTQIFNVEFSDTLDAGVEYINGSFKIDNGTVTPEVDGQDISYTIPTLNSGTTTIEFEVTVL